MTNQPTQPEAQAATEQLASWLEHELRLLEILTYRFDGLERLLKARQDTMLAQATDEIAEIRQQIGIADLHRDLAVSRIAAAYGDTEHPTIGRIIDRSDPEMAERLVTIRDAVVLMIQEIDNAQRRCAAVARGALEELSVPV